MQCWWFPRRKRGALGNTGVGIRPGRPFQSSVNPSHSVFQASLPPDSETCSFESKIELSQFEMPSFPCVFYKCFFVVRRNPFPGFVLKGKNMASSEPSEKISEHFGTRERKISKNICFPRFWKQASGSMVPAWMANKEGFERVPSTPKSSVQWGALISLPGSVCGQSASEPPRHPRGFQRQRNRT